MLSLHLSGGKIMHFTSASSSTQVKWLSEITVTAVESDNFYHYHDNRVMPSHVDEALAKEEGESLQPSKFDSLHHLTAGMGFAGEPSYECNAPSRLCT